MFNPNIFFSILKLTPEKITYLDLLHIPHNYNAHRRPVLWVVVMFGLTDKWSIFGFNMGCFKTIAQKISLQFPEVCLVKGHNLQNTKPVDRRDIKNVHTKFRFQILLWLGCDVRLESWKCLLYSSNKVRPRESDIS